MEEALHDVPLHREFAKLEGVAARLRVVNDILQAEGMLMRTGTVVDATLFSVPSSTKNAGGERDPEMKQTRKDNNWYFGMKAHIGVDARSGLVHSVIGTAANVNDLNVAGTLPHGDEQAAFGDAGYQEVHKRPEAARAGVTRGHAPGLAAQAQARPSSGTKGALRHRASACAAWASSRRPGGW